MYADGLRLDFYDAAVDGFQRAFAGEPHHPTGDLCGVVQNGTGFAARNKLSFRCIGPIGESFGDDGKARLAGEIENGRIGKTHKHQRGIRQP